MSNKERKILFRLDVIEFMVAFFLAVVTFYFGGIVKTINLRYLCLGINLAAIAFVIDAVVAMSKDKLKKEKSKKISIQRKEKQILVIER